MMKGVMYMDKRLNYRKLLKDWMQYYNLPAGISKRMFAAIWTRLQVLMGNLDEKGAETDETYME